MTHLRAHDDVTPAERLALEAMIYSALRHLAEDVGEDQHGLEFYQRTRMDAAAAELLRAPAD